MTQSLFTILFVCTSSVSLLQSKADSDVLDYKQLAALPRVKAVYDIQQPDIIPYQADHPHSQLSVDTLERYNCGQVHTHKDKLIQNIFTTEI